MAALVCDTHAAIWCLRNDSRLSSAATLALDSAVQSGDHIYVPSICLVEVTYLVEKGRLPRIALDLLRSSLTDPGFGFALASLDLEVVDALQSIPREDVPDLPDRVIAATAIAMRLPLVTRDHRIQSASIRTIW